MSVQTRYVKDPMGSVAEDVEAIAELPGNMVRAGVRVQRAAGDVTDSMIKDISGDEGVRAMGGFLEDYKNKTALREAGIVFEREASKEAGVLQEPGSYSKEEREEAMGVYLGYVARELGLEGPAGVMAYEGIGIKGEAGEYGVNEKGERLSKATLMGFYDRLGDMIYVNDSKQDGSTEGYVSVVGHEMGHVMMEKRGDEHSEEGSDRYGEQMWFSFRDEVGAGVLSDVVGHQSWVAGQDYGEVNRRAQGAEEIEGLSVWDVTDVAVFGFSATDAVQTWRDPESSGVDKAKTAGFLALDTIGLLPLVPSVGYVRHVDKVIDLTDSVSTAKQARELTALGRVGERAGQVSAGLSYGNNLHEVFIGDRSYNRFAIDTAFYFSSTIPKSGILMELSPSFTKFSRSDAFDSVLNITEYGVNKLLDFNFYNDKEE